ncbi:MAG: HAD family phosphatase [Nigerium sp.]|nr:HAD family phosphatase [Nigerium sp.]
MPRIILTDVDGTLVDYDNTLPVSAVDAIRRARTAGHQVFLCTGRARAEVYDDLWEIGVDGLIGGNGNYIEHHGEVVLHSSLTGDQCRAVVDWLDDRGLVFYLESNAGLFGSVGFEDGAVDAVHAYTAGTGAASMSVREAFPHMIFDADLYRDDVMKISYALRSVDDHRAASAAFPELKAGTWGGVGGHPLFGDLGVPAVTKAHAVSALLEHLDADVADTIAFGDATVDLPMFEACATSVAMGNAPDEVKDAADLVTDAVADDGLAHAFRRLGLI